MTAALVQRVDPEQVAAIDPSDAFVEAMRQRFAEVDVHQAPAERIPFADKAFDASLAQLVVHFMSDPVAGLREMGRVTRTGGVVAACVWDHAGDAGPLSLFWDAVHAIDQAAPGEAELAGTRQGHLGELAADAGLVDVEETGLVVRVHCETFDVWWEPFTLGVGPAGVYVQSLDDAAREALLAECRRRLPSAPFDVEATAWAMRATAP